MVIFRNIPGIFKVLFSLPGLSTLKKQIDQARASGDTQAEQAAILGATIKWGSYLVKNFHVSIHVEGREHLPKAGPVVYVCNHQGYADIPVLCSVLDQIQFGFIAKDNLKQIPLYGTWMKRIRSVMIKRDDARASLKAISEGIDNINQGFSMLIFPEGTRAKGGPMNEFKKGALKLATKPGVPIIPISLNGTHEVYEKTGVLRGAPVDLIIHPAIETKGISKQEEKELSDVVFQIIYDGVEELKQKHENH